MDGRNRLIAVQSLQFAANRGNELHRAPSRADREHGVRLCILRKGCVHRLPPSAVFQVLMHMGDNADDFRWLWVYAADPKMLADGALAIGIGRPEPPSQIL